MQAEEKSSSDFESNSEAEKIFSSDENSCVVASISGPVMLQKPVKRPTRQWAAWTREEEESFFTALRQVGKNFEKITSRVKSKNKDQVRHYYYRLVRRMNKLLGPTLCLDAKNSKDTNAAMLRWWSLLEKYSCKASKLHLKPRRFKIFVETLEHQLLKDRKKTVRKRTQGENTSPSSTAAPNQNKPSASDSQPVKFVLVDSQNIQKLGPGKPSFKRNVSFGTNRSNTKGESISMKQAKRRKPGATSSIAYKKWEKAAIAGVSLVADAAEHVEREAADKDVGIGADQGQKCPDTLAGGLPPLPPLSRNHVTGSDLQTSMKLKLQLFPIDYSTRKALEMDKHNPHLELTLSTRKKISSVLEHINRKWGSSSVASGELMLFPDTVQRENLMCSRRWNQDSTASAADVYTVIGSPPVFRLRYGWFPSIEAASAPGFGPFAQHPSEMIVKEHADPLSSVNKNQVPIPSPANVTGHNDSFTVNPTHRFEGPFDTDASMSCYAKLPGDGNIRQNERDGSSIGEWADSLTNISVGDLLTEAADNEEIDCVYSPVIGTPPRLQHFSVVCDSFDAAVAAHISKYQNNFSFQSNSSPHHISSIWDGEETCDAFSFQKTAASAASSQKQALSSFGSIPSEAKEQMERTSPEDGPAEGYEVEASVESPPAHTDPAIDCLSDDQDILKNPVKDFSGLTDTYWPDSLGPLDLDLRSSNYHTEDVILSDSLSSLNRLIASSLDAFQSCSFFGADKNESEPKGENASHRISTGV